MRWERAVSTFFGGCSTSAYMFQYLLSDRVQTGQTICNGQTFEEYLGPLLKAVHDKYCEWLGTAYSKCTSLHIGLF